MSLLFSSAEARDRLWSNFLGPFGWVKSRRLRPSAGPSGSCARLGAVLRSTCGFGLLFPPLGPSWDCLGRSRSFWGFLRLSSGRWCRLNAFCLLVSLFGFRVSMFVFITFRCSLLDSWMLPADQALRTGRCAIKCKFYTSFDLHCTSFCKFMVAFHLHDTITLKDLLEFCAACHTQCSWVAHTQKSWIHWQVSSNCRHTGTTGVRAHVRTNSQTDISADVTCR